MDGLGDLVGDDEEGGDGQGNRTADGEADEDEAFAEFLVDEGGGGVGGDLAPDRVPVIGEKAGDKGDAACKGGEEEEEEAGPNLHLSCSRWLWRQGSEEA